MKEDKSVFVLIGPRGSGKSHYGKLLLENQPELSAISRDEIMLRRFGSVHTDPYTGAGYYAYEIVHRLLRRKLRAGTGIKLVLDLWTGESRERKSLIRKLRDYGASRVVALYFITPLEVVETWFWKKPGIAKAEEMRSRQGEKLVFFSKNAPAHDYRLFHELASKIDSDGFDEVIRVDPREKLVILT